MHPLPGDPSQGRPGTHPRACREQKRGRHSHSMLPGPSPRVRGAALLPVLARVVHGTIPARAGIRRARPASPGRGGDHPRACGEQIETHRATVPELGPSPRVRGAAHQHRRLLRHRGTIPARAGSRRPGAPCAGWAGDHPRACGEQKARAKATHQGLGPSPRVRGAARHDDAARSRDGTIPARAGSRRRPSALTSASGPSRDHPRACGGAAPAADVPGIRSGTIPARAGSRHSSGRPASPARDHPRACGEQTA